LNARRAPRQGASLTGPPKKPGLVQICASIRGFELAIDGMDRQIVLQTLERLFDLDEVRIVPPRMASIVAHDIGARQIERDEV